MRRRTVVSILAAAAVAGFVLFVVPQIADLGPTLRRLRAGNPGWLGAGVALEAISLTAYAALFHGIFSRTGARIGWRSSFQITFAGDVATKLFASAGAGGIALTVWSLRASGLDSQTVASRMVAFEVMLYAVYVAALVGAGLGLSAGVFPGPAPSGLTLVPALAGLVLIVVAVATPSQADRWERRLQRRASRAHGKAAQRWKRVAQVPRALSDGLPAAWGLVRTRAEVPLSAVGYWAFDIAALWASFRAFGHAPPAAVLVAAYFIGTLANTLPLPGGIGGVEGGLIGAFIGFGVHADLAVLAVLAYRAISYWLPTLPGVVAYFRLRRTVAGWQAAPGGS
ncbi:MAG: putative heme transporter [Solirubrobacteraceae bacterium]|jgi:uncharacterized protein (TIRG00374 family)|nr:putative heme transporter [Solirubrobacteraceae bacterium]